MRIPNIIKTVPEMIQWRKSTAQSVGFVPTMGALHRGHAQLLQESKNSCKISVLSIFVNPTQFGPKEDLSRYPRPLEQDIEHAGRMGTDVVFLPEASQMYPQDFSTYVEEGALSQPLCGIFRPGHFRGVTTIVLKLLNIVRPEIAFFGLKDAQQFFVLQKMIRDLHLDVLIRGIPTVRESDGLALSSRNIYLSTEDRKIAPSLFQELKAVRNNLLLGTPLSEALQIGRTNLEAKGFELQYFECLNLTTFKSVLELQPNQQYLIATASFLGSTRLIDNIQFST